MDEFDMICLFGSSCWREGSMYSPYIEEKKCSSLKEANGGEQISKLSGVSVQNQAVNLDNDIKALETVFGPMEPGKTIELALSELLKICPRKRRKSDAFLSLKKQLQKAYGVGLCVAPNVKRNVKN